MLSALHLAAVICGACYLPPERSRTPAAQMFRWYATMSGADTSYGFFAPNVGDLHRARFLLRDEKGQTWWDSFDVTKSPEARLRLTGIVDCAFLTGEAMESPEWRNRLVRSWSATMLNRHPSAASLTAVVEVYDVPTMAKYRAGSRPNWQGVYQAELQRRASVGQERVEP
jgi:hypothetical protein